MAGQDSRALATYYARTIDAQPPKLPPWARPLELPTCPPGWRTAPPDFVGVGVQRAGTSWWSSVIESHPRVVRPDRRPKELHYFDRFWQGEPPDDFAARYHELFPRPPGAISGEWTPRYMYDFWTPPLLAAAAPDARFLVLLRDPVERYLSGLSRHVRGAEKEGRFLRLQELSDAIYRGVYEPQLRRLFEYVPRDRVLVLQYERCRADPAGQMAATFAFLGLQAPDRPPEQLEVRSRPWRFKPELSAPARAELVERLRADVEAVAALCPEIDVALWPSFADRAPASGS